jgi:hypothetical protein
MFSLTWRYEGQEWTPVGEIDDQYLDNTRYDKDKALGGKAIRILAAATSTISLMSRNT